VGRAGDVRLLRYSLGVEYLKAGDRPRASERLREALERDPDYSAAWKLLGRALAESDKPAEALEAWKRGIEAAHRRADREAEKEMTVFARRLERSAAK